MEADPVHQLYETDLRARMRRGGISGEPYLRTNTDGSYKRTDLEADYQTFKASWDKPRKRG